MRFYVRKRRGPPAIIIVALIDILIVLLIFLMATTAFKQQPALRLALPESSQAEKSGANEATPLVVSIDSQGNFRFGTDAKPVTFDQLRAGLANAVARNPELSLTINGDRGAPWGQIVKVMDAAKEAHVKNVKGLMKETAKP